MKLLNGQKLEAGIAIAAALTIGCSFLGGSQTSQGGVLTGKAAFAEAGSEATHYGSRPSRTRRDTVGG